MPTEELCIPLRRLRETDRHCAGAKAVMLGRLLRGGEPVTGPGATQRIHTGQRIEVDGGRGLVRVLSGA